MKTNAIVRIVLYTAAILILMGILTTALMDHQYTYDPRFDYGDLSDTTEAIEQFDLEYITPEIRNIEIEWVAGSITFQKDPFVTEIQVTEISPVDSKYQMICKQSGQTLKIKFCEEDFGLISFGIDMDVSKDLVITVPSNWECNSLEIDTAASEVILNDLTVREFDLDGASGECRMTDCDIGKLDIDTASGNVFFSGTLDALDFDAASADCAIEVTNIPRSIELDGMSGDLELILPPDAGFTCVLDSMSGTFDSDFEFRTVGETYIHGDGSCKINVSAVSGDVSILKGIE